MYAKSSQHIQRRIIVIVFGPRFVHQLQLGLATWRFRGRGGADEFCQQLACQPRHGRPRRAGKIEDLDAWGFIGLNEVTFALRSMHYQAQNFQPDHPSLAQTFGTNRVAHCLVNPNGPPTFYGTNQARGSRAAAHKSCIVVVA